MNAKKIIFLLSAFFPLFGLSSFREADAAAPMTDYCVVPPYVIQNVPPNILMLVDNSASMLNFAYACPTGFVGAAGINTSVIPLDKVIGFKVGMKVQLMHAGAVQNTLWISAVDSANKTITVTTLVSFVQGDFIQDYGCNNVVSLYDEPAATCTTNATRTTVSNAAAGATIINVADNNVFTLGQYIVFSTAGNPQLRYVVDKLVGNNVRVDSPVTVAAVDYVYDATCFYFRTPEPEQSFVPSRAYYGYFNDKYYYTYTGAGGKFLPSRFKGNPVVPKAADEWDGNFLNWLMMRRTDVLRRVLTGGRAIGGEGAGFDKLRTIKPDFSLRGTFKAVSNAELYTGCTNCTGNMNFGFTAGGADPSSFTAYTGNYQDTFTNRGSFSGDIRVPLPVEGVLQDVVSAKARVGLMFYRRDEGGFIQVDVGDTSVTPPKGLPATINQINLTNPSANTPVGEALWSATGYFARQAAMEGGPGPRYALGDYNTTNNNQDPLNYGTGGQPRYPNCSKSFVLLVTDGEPCSDGNLPANVLSYTTGKSIFNCAGSACPATAGIAPENFSFPASALPTCPAGNNLSGIEDVALYMHTKDLRADVANKNNLTLYTVFAFGKNSTLLKYAAINGGFDDFDNTGMPDKQAKWDANGDGEPDTYYEADDGYELEQAMRNALSTMLRRASSGTAASVLASGEGSGANLVQAVFYPRRRFGNDIIGWTGLLQNLWYYVDPFFGNSSIREDTDHNNELHLQNDYIAQLYFDTTTQTARAKRFIDSDGDGDADSQTTTVEFENLGNLWEAGNLLWQRFASDRTIYTNCSVDASLCIGSTGLMNFNTASAPLVTSPLVPLLNVTDKNANGILDEAQYAIQFVRGEELTSRDTDGDGINDIIGIDLDFDGTDDYRNRTVTVGGETHVWKLGDILNSTPKISSWVALNQYDKTYKPYEGDTYKNFIQTDSSTPTVNYKGRGMVYAGGNDGMLHAFKLGSLELVNDTSQPKLKARLTGADKGKEMWAFIPKNVLPYLNYMGDPDYCHIYSVDLTPYLVDASIEKPATCTATDYWDCARDMSSWRTILIGGMRYGGACKNASYTTCSSGATTATNLQTIDLNGDGSVNNSDCVRTPITDVGFSSYFALDVTDQSSAPKLLWEYTHPNLGNTTTGPTVVRINARTVSGSSSNADPLKNGRWFVVFGSGPTGPIDTTNNQFLGTSDQNLKLFVLDLKTGQLATTLPIDTSVPYAFAGSMLNASHDTDLDYQDDVVYVPYVKRVGASAPYSWTGGGILRLSTKEDLNGASTGAAGTTAINANNWVTSTLIDGVGPVTSATVRLQNKAKGQLWVYGGAGRYFYVNSTTTDDSAGQRAIFGMKDPCYSAAGFDYTCVTPRTFCATQCSNPAGTPPCTSPVTCGDLTNVTNIANVPADPDVAAFKGWYINTDPPGTYSYLEGATTVSRPFFAERTITDPLSTSSGLVFFTTYKPYNEECGVGGKSFIWSAKYNTGGAPGSLLKGMALIQVSTGAIEQLDLSTAFSDSSGRKTSAMEGVPPQQQGLSLITSPPPLKRSLHLRER